MNARRVQKKATRPAFPRSRLRFRDLLTLVCLSALLLAALPGTALAVLPGDDFTLTVTKTNDADASTLPDENVTFTVTVANPNAFPVTITDVTDSYGATEIDVCDGVGPGDVDLVGLQLAANGQVGDDATCIFTLTNYAPAEGVTLTNTIEIAAEAAGGTRAPDTRFLIVDEDSIDNGRNYLTDNDDNGTFTDLNQFPASGMGENDPQKYQRTPLPFMQAAPADGGLLGRELLVRGGQVGDAAYFEIDETQLPSSWTSAGPTSDPIRNFYGDPTLEPGHAVPSGLGGIPGNENESLLDKIDGVAYRNAANPPALSTLVGEQLCLLVKDSDLSFDSSKNELNLQSGYLGVFAVEVLGVVDPPPSALNGSDALAALHIQILGAVDVCGIPDDLLGGGTATSGVTTPVQPEPGSLNVVKNLEPSGDPGDFTLFIKDATGTTTIDSEPDAQDGDSTGANPVAAGTYEVSETADAGTTLSFYTRSISCVDAGGNPVASNTTGAPLSVPVASDQDVTCTITNSRNDGTLNVVKDLIPSSDPGDFTLFIKDSTGTTTIDSEPDAQDGDDTDPNSLDPGTYEVSETADAGTTLSDYTRSIRCVNAAGTVVASNTDGTPLNVPVQSNDAIVCTITNSRDPGTLNVVKDLIPSSDPGDFNLFIKNSSGATVESETNAQDGDSTGATPVAPGTYEVSETAFDSNTTLSFYTRSISCVDAAGNPVASNTTGAPLDVPVASDQDVTCTITNSRNPGTLNVVKNLEPSSDDGRFTLFIKNSGGTTLDSEPDAEDGDDTDPNSLAPGTYQVSETADAGTTLSDYVRSIRCVNGGGTVVASNTTGAALNVPVQSNQDIVCTITNTRKGTAEVVKTVNGAAPAGSDAFTFQLRQGASTTSLGTILESVTANAGNGGVEGFATLLIPGDTYQFCEANMMPGWDTTLDNGDFGTAFVPGSTLPDPDNSVICVNFTVTPGEQKTFVVNNVPPPGGDARTIGFWKNWTSCDGSGNQAAVLDQVLASFPIADGQTTHGVFIGDIYVDTCNEAVKILNKSKLNGTKMASDAAYGLAAQLLAAKLNIQATAGSCTAADDAILNGQKLLSGQAPYNTSPAIHFTATGDYLGSKSKGAALTRRNQANALASTLDSYNNNLLCP